MNPVIPRMALRLSVLACAALASSASWSTVVFLNKPTNNSTVTSWHNTVGPVLADDFVATRSGLVTQVQWWGSTANSNSWELALHTNAASNQPNVDNATSGSNFKYIVNATGVHIAGDPVDVLRYSATLTGPLMTIAAGANYWFTAANAADGWTWADALGGPTVGSENFNTHRSVGGAGACGDGGPHCGPWADVHTDMAFAITAVPQRMQLVTMLVDCDRNALTFSGQLGNKFGPTGNCTLDPTGGTPPVGTTLANGDFTVEQYELHETLGDGNNELTSGVFRLDDENNWDDLNDILASPHGKVTDGTLTIRLSGLGDVLATEVFNLDQANVLEAALQKLLPGLIQDGEQTVTLNLRDFYSVAELTAMARDGRITLRYGDDATISGAQLRLFAEVPEPGSSALVALALGAVAVTTRRGSRSRPAANSL